MSRINFLQKSCRKSLPKSKTKLYYFREKKNKSRVNMDNDYTLKNIQGKQFKFINKK